MGISQLAVSFPVGILADRYRRDTFLKVGSIVGLIAAVFTLIATRAASMPLLCASLVFWGMFWGITNTVVSALFADSMLTGDRSYYFSHLMIVQMLGNASGPLAALFMFSRLGNEWNAEACSSVIGVGQCLALPALAILWFLNDDYCIASNDCEETEHEESTDEESNGESTEEESISTDDDSSDDSDEENQSQTSERIALNQTDDDEQEEEQDFLCIPSARVVPVLVASADFLGGFAAGMSMRYFPIFFMDNLKMNPEHVQIVFFFCMTNMALFGKLVQRLGTKLGRVQTTILCKWIGVFLMVSLIHGFKSGMSPALLSVLYIFRSAFMNCSKPLTRSILMDHVPKEERAKWSALESVNSFSWSGSAALGGFLVDIEGILFNFSITATLQLLATIPLIIVFRRVRSEN